MNTFEHILTYINLYYITYINLYWYIYICGDIDPYEPMTDPQVHHRTWVVSPAYLWGEEMVQQNHLVSCGKETYGLIMVDD